MRILNNPKFTDNYKDGCKKPGFLQPSLLFSVLCAEGCTVGALTHCRVRLVSSYLDLIESAVVVALGVVLALRYGAFNAFVISTALVVHNGS